VISRISILTVVLLSVIFGASAQNDLENTQTDSISVDIRNAVVPITSLKLVPAVKTHFLAKPTPQIGVGARLGTGFCLDSACRFVVTNYHAAISSSVRRIKGRRIVRRYLATGKDDKDATVHVLLTDNVALYAAKRDLALYELDKPIRGYRGLRFSLDDLEPGQEVDIYSFPYDFNPFRRLKRVTARFNAPTTSGLLVFDCDPGPDKQIHLAGGSSGGIVVDRKTQRIVGIINGLNGTMAFAVPVKALVDFVSKVQPFVSVTTFPGFSNIPPEAVDIYPKFEPQPDFTSKFEPVHTGILQHRPIELPDITLMREKAQRLADSIRNFTAVQSYAWGAGDREPKVYAEYEVKVVDGWQSFREYPDGKKESDQVVLPNLPWSATGSNEWSEFPRMLGTEYKLQIRRAEDSEVNGSKIQIFQYRAEVEDKLCPFKPITDYGLFQIGHVVEVGCYGEAWIDQEGNIVRISETLELSDRRKEYKGWTDYRVVITYGPVKIGDEPVRFAPRTVFTEGQNGKRILWCRGTFFDYHMFASHSRLLAAAQDEHQQDPKQPK
jgi:hypothetical protein